MGADQTLITDFLSVRAMAVVGASNTQGKFGRLACRELKARGFQVFPVNPYEKRIDGERCWREVKELYGTVNRIVIVLPPVRTEQIARELDPALIRYVWMQNGAESPEAIRICQAKGIDVIHGQCILMHAEPVRSYHLLHRLWAAVLDQRRLT